MAKSSAKERIAQRKLQDEQRKNKYRQDDIQRQAAKEKLAEEEAARAEAERYAAEIGRIEALNPNMKTIVKSQAKAAGLKSTFVVSNGKLLMTSFGKGNVANPDKYIVDKTISDASDITVLNVENADRGFTVSGRLVSKAIADNPLESVKEVGMDQIRCKDKLEKIYFGQTFDDNIHIQLIYNILDIEKILTVHVNNIVYELDNMLRRDEEEHDDLIGYLGDRKNFAQFKNSDIYNLFKQLIDQRQMGYFGNLFLGVDAKGKALQGEARERFEEKCYYLLMNLGIARQATAHGEEKSRANIYNIGKLTKLSKAGAELDSLYAERINELNRSFLETSGKDLEIIFSIFNVSDDNERSRLARELYEFVILKSYKNLGFSIKRVRENLAIIEPELKDNKYNSVRKKLNKHLDFVIWKHYKENDNRLNELVEKLRASSKESEKEMIYRREAKNLWAEIKDAVEHKVLPKMDGDYIKSLEGAELDMAVLGEKKLSEEADSFSKLIYLITIFLDGKEINDLLTQLISSFDNIASFVDVLKNENLPVKFTDRYVIFENCEKISRELRVINSFARMTSSDSVTKKTMFIEAAELLGYDDGEKLSISEYIDEIIDKKKGKMSGGKKDNGFRNFIINNVIESSRFKYLVRYGNPKKVKKLACNRAVVDFVLKDIPDDQIKAYYNSCNGTIKAYSPDMRDNLADRITRLSFKDFENVKQGKTQNSAEAEDKERKKNIVRLYLTVLYLLVKNLVYVNSRYYLAFHCAERDALVYDRDEYKDLLDSEAIPDRRRYAIDFVNKYSNNSRAKKYINHNYNNSDKGMTKIYRNCVEHLNAVRNADKYIDDVREFGSYFELYHYLMQRTVIQKYEYESTTPSKKYPGTMIFNDELNPSMEKYFEMVKKYRTYCKDMVKALNIPFAYNLARYKNLSINELFDRNNYLPKHADGIECKE